LISLVDLTDGDKVKGVLDRIQAESQAEEAAVRLPHPRLFSEKKEMVSP
jgi:hypothetical protein